MKRLVAAAGAAALLTTVFANPAHAQQGFDVFTVARGDALSIGASVQDLPGEEAAKLKIESGVRVSSVQEGTPAARAGLRNGDIVVEFDGERVRSVTQFSRLVRESAPTRAARTTIVRDGVRQTLNITPETATARAWTVPESRATIVQPFSSTQKSTPFRFDNFTFVGNPANAQLGVTVTALEAQLAAFFGVKQGVLVSAVAAGTPAEAAGIKAGDVITSINGRTVDQPSQVADAVRAAQAGSSIELKIVRDKKELTLKATLAERTRVQWQSQPGSRVRL